MIETDNLVIRVRLLNEAVLSKQRYGIRLAGFGFARGINYDDLLPRRYHRTIRICCAFDRVAGSLPVRHWRGPIFLDDPEGWLEHRRLVRGSFSPPFFQRRIVLNELVVQGDERLFLIVVRLVHILFELD